MQRIVTGVEPTKTATNETGKRYSIQCHIYLNETAKEHSTVQVSYNRQMQSEAVLCTVLISPAQQTFPTLVQGLCAHRCSSLYRVNCNLPTDRCPSSRGGSRKRQPPSTRLDIYKYKPESQCSTAQLSLQSILQIAKLNYASPWTHLKKPPVRLQCHQSAPCLFYALRRPSHIPTATAMHLWASKYYVQWPYGDTGRLQYKSTQRCGVSPDAQDNRHRRACDPYGLIRN